tara:strand:- start:248 stop:766 length:519 start_codon:yes stop_codon:yes gene_type:complete
MSTLKVDTIQGKTTSGTVQITGHVVQVVNVQDGEVASGTTTIAYDDTIMQNTEGVEFMTLAITPTSATNKLKIDVVCHCNSSVGNKIFTVGLFQDSTADALAMMAETESIANSPTPVSFTHFMTAGTTSSTTFKVRAGPDSSATITFNGRDGTNRRGGGRYASSITITEISQ